MPNFRVTKSHPKGYPSPPIPEGRSTAGASDKRLAEAFEERARRLATALEQLVAGVLVQVEIGSPHPRRVALDRSPARPILCQPRAVPIAGERLEAAHPHPDRALNGAGCSPLGRRAYLDAPCRPTWRQAVGAVKRRDREVDQETAVDP